MNTPPYDRPAAEAVRLMATAGVEFRFGPHGGFVWPLDPPAEHAAFVAACRAAWEADPDLSEGWTDAAVVEHVRRTEGW